MPVILLEPPRPENPERFEDVVNAPLSACLFTGYIAAVLKRHSIETETADAHLHGWPAEQTIGYLSKKTSLLLCVHTVYLWEKTQNIFDLLSEVKARKRNIHINLYGYYPSFAYGKILQNFPWIDSVTVGEPEFTTLDLAVHILSRDGISQSPSYKDNVGIISEFSDKITIPGLAYRDLRGDVVFHPRPHVRELDQLPYPERQDIDLYQKKGIAVYIQGSRGCYGHCTFCYLNSFHGQTSRWRGRSAENVFGEVLMLYTRYSVKDFYFSDANFFGPGKYGKERAVTLAELILSHNLPVRFGFECRVNDIDEYTLSKLVMAGLTHVFLGLESGDPASLKRFRKHTTVDQNKKAIQLLRDYGIEPTFGFIMFEPNSTPESVRNNFEFLKETGIMTTPVVTAHLLYHRQTLLGGTPDYQAMVHEVSGTHTFTGYEALYQIKDPKVEVLSEIISTVCRSFLSLLPKTFDCSGQKISARNTESDLMHFVNSSLIAVFEKTLSGVENGTIDCYNPGIVKEVSQKLMDEMRVQYE